MESFRLPPSEDVNAAHVKRSLPNEHFTKGTYKPSSDKTEDNLSKPSNSTSTMQVGDDYETLVTMFICKKAAAQFAGADKHFPGRPPTARPRGAPPPRTARSSHLHHSPIPRAWSYLNASAIITVGLPSEYPVSKEGILRPWLCTSGPSNRVVAWVVYEGPRPWTRLELVFNEHEHP